MDIETMKHSLSLGSRWTDNSAQISNKGFITDIILTLPKFKNDVTTTLTIHDEAGAEIWNSGPKKKNQVHAFLGIHIPALIEYRAKVRLSGNPGGDYTAGLRLFLNV